MLINVRYTTMTFALIYEGTTIQ